MPHYEVANCRCCMGWDPEQWGNTRYRWRASNVVIFSPDPLFRCDPQASSFYDFNSVTPGCQNAESYEDALIQARAECNIDDDDYQLFDTEAEALAAAQADRCVQLLEDYSPKYGVKEKCYYYEVVVYNGGGQIECGGVGCDPCDYLRLLCNHSIMAGCCGWTCLWFPPFLCAGYSDCQGVSLTEAMQDNCHNYSHADKSETINYNAVSNCCEWPGINDDMPPCV